MPPDRFIFDVNRLIVRREKLDPVTVGVAKVKEAGQPGAEVSRRAEFDVPRHAGADQEVRGGHELHGLWHGVSKVMDTGAVALCENDVVRIAFALKENEYRLLVIGIDDIF